MIINASIQVIPLRKDKEEAYAVVDEIIELIKESRMKYIIGAFETTIEGPYTEVQSLTRKIQDVCYSKKNMEFLIYTKLHISGAQDIKLADKRLDR